MICHPSEFTISVYEKKNEKKVARNTEREEKRHVITILLEMFSFSIKTNSVSACVYS